MSVFRTTRAATFAACATALLLLGLGIGGCGSDSTSTPTTSTQAAAPSKESYMEGLRHATTLDIGRDWGTDPLTTVQQEHEEAARAVSELQALTPPDEAQQAHAMMLAAYQTVLSAANAQLELVQSMPDPKQAAQLVHSDPAYAQKYKAVRTAFASADPKIYAARAELRKIGYM